MRRDSLLSSSSKQCPNPHFVIRHITESVVWTQGVCWRGGGGGTCMYMYVLMVDISSWRLHQVIYQNWPVKTAPLCHYSCLQNVHEKRAEHVTES